MKRSLRLVRLERSGIGPENPFFLRLRTRSWVREVRECGKLPLMLRFSRTKRVTRLWRQETPSQESVHGLEDEFQVVRAELLGSAVDLKIRRGSASGLLTAAA